MRECGYNSSQFAVRSSQFAVRSSLICPFFYPKSIISSENRVMSFLSNAEDTAR